ncbi:hypothetical protein PUN28_008160 [Cardiocondyla obscurior]|uniref:Uncharacterized protein n=1 Tax=Cardiocondyla obscurior TaxID=286306 RepID=A0AAW2FZL3_9HYME
MIVTGTLATRSASKNPPETVCWTRKIALSRAASRCRNLFSVPIEDIFSDSGASLILASIPSNLEVLLVYVRLYQTGSQRIQLREHVDLRTFCLSVARSRLCRALQINISYRKVKCIMSLRRVASSL